MFLTPGAIDTSAVRPSRLTGNKDKDYHKLFARWCIGGAFNNYLNAFYMKSMINWNFYRGNQWLYNEDLTAFLMDESGDVRNRVKFVENIIRPMVEQYVGNAIRTDYTYRATSINETVINRRELQLAKLKTLTNLANKTSPEFGDMLRNNLPIGKDAAETEDSFGNYYVDQFEKGINNLIKYISLKNDFEKLKVEATKHLAVTGLMILQCYEQGGEMVWKVQDPLYFFFDRGAKRPDLKDAEYMGNYQYMLPTEIFEMYEKLTSRERKAIENYAKSQKYQNTQYAGAYMESLRGRVPVYQVYWKDTEKQEYGYVYDEFGYEFFTRINGHDSKYTDKDLISPSEESRKVKMKGKLKKTIFVDNIRFCIFIPKEELGVNGQDIVLDWGLEPYSETYLYDPSNIEFPWKCYCWSYHNGFIQSPIDDTIDPQRYINRCLSVAESQINNSRGSGTIIDKDMVDPQGGEEDILRNMNNSKPIFVNAKGNLNNSIGSYDATIGSGTQMLFSIVDQMKGLIQSVTGINEAMVGAAGGKRELVGVVDAQLQRGTLIQEPFYYAIGELMKQCYQSMAQKGKRIYATNQRRLAIITGDERAEELIITKNYLLEDFRVFIKRTPPEVDSIAAGNTMALQLLEMGALDQETFSKIFGISTPDEVSRAVREYGRRTVEIQKKEAEMQAQAGEQEVMQAQAQMEQMQMQEQGMMEQQAFEKQADRENKLEQIALKETLKNQENK